MGVPLPDAHAPHVVPLPVMLERGAVYLSPSGRRCRWWPSPSDHGRRVEALILYDTPQGQPAQSPRWDGFVLSAANWYLLRRLA
jgi:hypothetical protein